MVDMIKGVIDYHSRNTIDSIIHQLNGFQIEERKDLRTGELIYHTNVRGMKLTIRPQNRTINFSNSLPKFIQGNNYENLTYNKLCIGIEEFCDIFQCTQGNVYLTRLEVGYNMIVPESPLKYLKTWMSHKNKSFYPIPPKRSAEPLEYYCPKSQYWIKGYDSGTWNNLDQNENRLKFELKFTSMQKVYDILKSSRRTERIHLGFLIHEPFLRAMNDFVEQTYSSIQKRPSYSSSILSSRDRQLLFAGESPEYWQLEKENSRNYHKKLRSRFNQLHRALPKDTLDLLSYLRTEAKIFFQN